MQKKQQIDQRDAHKHTQDLIKLDSKIWEKKDRK